MNPQHARAVFIFAALSLVSPFEQAALAQSSLPASSSATVEIAGTDEYGPAAALKFAHSYRGEVYKPNTLYCYPDAVGVPFADCENIIPMTAVLWTPAQIRADFERRMARLPAQDRKQGIIVVLKTERCAPKFLRACTVTTAALEKRSSPLVGEFAIYGLLLKPRDHDEPAGSLPIETGFDAWKNQAAGEYQFKQGPGATLVFLDPADGVVLNRTDAVELRLRERDFVKNGGSTPALHTRLAEILAKIQNQPRIQND